MKCKRMDLRRTRPQDASCKKQPHPLTDDASLAFGGCSVACRKRAASVAMSLCISSRHFSTSSFPKVSITWRGWRLGTEDTTCLREAVHVCNSETSSCGKAASFAVQLRVVGEEAARVQLWIRFALPRNTRKASFMPDLDTPLWQVCLGSMLLRYCRRDTTNAQLHQPSLARARHAPCRHCGTFIYLFVQRSALAAVVRQNASPMPASPHALAHPSPLASSSSLPAKF